MRALVACLLTFLLAGCGAVTAPAPETSATLRDGPWRMVLDIHGRQLPVLFDVHADSSGVIGLTIHNGKERIEVSEVDLDGDSVRVRMPLFDAELLAVRQGDSTLTGVCWNHVRRPGEDRIPFVARAGGAHRFNASAPAGDVGGHWEAHFSLGTPDGYAALGLFHQGSDGRVTGTFGTETGDYRFLEGVLDGDTLRLSSFNGSQAFLFTAVLRNDSLQGLFSSGIHWSEPWSAVRNPSFRLRNPDSLTVLKEGHDMVHLRFPGLDGDTISTTDERYHGKPLLVQIMGSWCANCVDETVLLDELYERYQDDGLEVIAVAFEKQTDRQRALAGLERFKRTLDVDYPILFAGAASKENTRSQLPFLEHVMSYPTCIFIDRSGKVRKIHTGFYGPGTGPYYEAFKRDLEAFVQQLVADDGGLTAQR
jgi:thiol-disulfide isomerase/thioredoxin